MSRIQRLALVAVLLLAGCRAGTRPPLFSLGPARPVPDPALVLAQVQRAMNERDLVLYESLLDDRFLFVETDCQGRMFDLHDRSLELELVGGAPGRAKPGVFRAFGSFAFALATLEHRQEPGLAHPDKSGDPGGHPGETWEVFRTRVQMRMTSTRGDTLPPVEAILTYKLRLDPERRWKIIRIVHSPLPEECGRALPQPPKVEKTPR